ncbi:MAG: site-2 protease family protein [Nitrospirota bacterium]|nr:MAG: site-2 protease family protein [Nitrospirota bacterium]
MDRTFFLNLLIAIPGILVAITFHEAAHGFAAYRLGDETAKAQGRLTLNPLSHIDPVGTIIVPAILFLFAGFVIGWAKPVPVNPYNMRNPKRDMALSAAAGPLTNIAIALISIIIIRILIFPLSDILSASLSRAILQPIYLMFQYSAVINVVLAVFNMIPLPPLDGGRVAIGFLPHKEAEFISRLEPYGFMIIIFLFFILGIGRYIFGPLIQFIYLLTT